MEFVQSPRLSIETGAVSEKSYPNELYFIGPNTTKSPPPKRKAIAICFVVEFVMYVRPPAVKLRFQLDDGKAPLAHFAAL